MRILFIQVEFTSFAQSLPWTYHCHVGMARALMQAGHEVDVVLTVQPSLLMRLVERGEYDLAIVNDLVHGLASPDPKGWRVPAAALRRLRQRGVPMLGTIIESIFHGPGDVVDDPHQRQRQQAIEQASVWLDFMITYDRFDAGVLRDAGCRALWTPFFSEAPAGPQPTEVSRSLSFLGAMYPKRQQFVASAGVQARIACGYIDYGAAFHEVFERLIAAVCEPHAEPSATMDVLSKFKQGVFEIYVRRLMQSALVINLPTIFKGIPCRLVEAMVTGRPSVSPRPRHADERALLALAPRRACLLYDDTEPEAFAPLLDTAAGIMLDAQERAKLRSFVERSPFAPAMFAAHLTDFVTGRREATQIEAGYLRAAPGSGLKFGS